MNSPTLNFDTHEAVKGLTSAGWDVRHAEGVVNLLKSIGVDNAAKQTQLDKIEIDVNKLETGQNKVEADIKEIRGDIKDIHMQISDLRVEVQRMVIKIPAVFISMLAVYKIFESLAH